MAEGAVGVEREALARVGGCGAHCGGGGGGGGVDWFE